MSSTTGTAGDGGPSDVGDLESRCEPRRRHSGGRAWKERHADAEGGARGPAGRRGQAGATSRQDGPRWAGADRSPPRARRPGAEVAAVGAGDARTRRHEGKGAAQQPGSCPVSTDLEPPPMPQDPVGASGRGRCHCRPGRLSQAMKTAARLRLRHRLRPANDGPQNTRSTTTWSRWIRDGPKRVGWGPWLRRARCPVPAGSPLPEALRRSALSDDVLGVRVRLRPAGLYSRGLACGQKDWAGAVAHFRPDREHDPPTPRTQFQLGASTPSCQLAGHGQVFVRLLSRRPDADDRIRGHGPARVCQFRRTWTPRKPSSVWPTKADEHEERLPPTLPGASQYRGEITHLRFRAVVCGCQAQMRTDRRKPAAAASGLHRHHQDGQPRRFRRELVALCTGLYDAPSERPGAEGLRDPRGPPSPSCTEIGLRKSRCVVRENLLMVERGASSTTGPKVKVAYAKLPPPLDPSARRTRPLPGRAGAGGAGPNPRPQPPGERPAAPVRPDPGRDGGPGPSSQRSRRQIL
jgi:hypothetical protein